LGKFDKPIIKILRQGKGLRIVSGIFKKKNKVGDSHFLMLKLPKLQ
jgi:hypothetical protein